MQPRTRLCGVMVKVEVSKVSELKQLSTMPVEHRENFSSKGDSSGKAFFP